MIFVKTVLIGPHPIPYGQRMPRSIATNTTIDRTQLVEFLRPRHRMILLTPRTDGGWQGSPVTAGVDVEGRIVVSTYPERAKAANVARHGRAAVLALSDEFDGPWVQVEGPAELIRLPAALDPLVEYFRCISGEHPDWDEYRAAMTAQGKALIRIAPERWGPIATGGFPAHRA
jgi:PPOX class probable F420-dependent enzyme